MSTHYETLGVSESASDTEIKTAYKKLAKKHHPDVNNGNDAQFKKVNEAYDNIKTTDKRQMYDAQRKFGPNVHINTGNSPFGFSDIFEEFFGGHGQFQQRRQRKNRTTSIVVPITLENAFHGIKKQISVQLSSGKRQIVDLNIPAGVNNGMTLNYKGLGDDAINNIPPGDLQVRLQINRHSQFERKGNDLYTTRQINAFEAMLGTKVIIKTIAGKTIKANVQPGTQPGTFIRLPNEGMPVMKTSINGHLFVRIDINIPSNLTQRQKELLAKNFNQ